jgi:dihydrodipicolinate synthase/N-acetylneuraminate lyase
MTHPKSSLRGVIPSLIVPFRGEQIDRDALAREAEFLSEAGVHGLAIGGGVGEMVGRTAEETAAACRVVKQVSALPLGVILLPDCLPEMDALVDAVAAEEPDTLFVAQPHYLFQPAAKELAEMLLRARARSRRPVFLANILRSAMVPATVVEELMANGALDGLLQGGVDPHIVVDTLAIPARLPVLCSVDDLSFTALALGADGILSTLATLLPQEMVALHKEVAAGDFKSARSRHETMIRIWRFLDHASEAPRRFCFALEAQGRPIGEPFAPFNSSRGSVAMEVRDLLLRERVLQAG